MILLVPVRLVQKSNWFLTTGFSIYTVVNEWLYLYLSLQEFLELRCNFNVVKYFCMYKLPLQTYLVTSVQLAMKLEMLQALSSSFYNLPSIH